jgi:hypothetical protein
MSFTTARPRAALIACFAVAASARRIAPSGAQTPLAGVAEALGRAGTDQPGGVVRFGLPRQRSHRRRECVTLKPALALGSWVAFEPMDRQARWPWATLVLLESEVGRRDARAAGRRRRADRAAQSRAQRVAARDVHARRRRTAIR